MVSQNKIKTFTDLKVWQMGHHLVLEIYKLTKDFPSEEKFCLVNQLRRVAISITSNLAEGFSWQSYKEKIQFYSISQGSTTEVQNQLLIVKDLLYVTKEKFNELADMTVQIHKMINGLIKSSKNLNS